MSINLQIHDLELFVKICWLDISFRIGRGANLMTFDLRVNGGHPIVMTKIQGIHIKVNLNIFDLKMIRGIHLLTMIDVHNQAKDFKTIGCTLSDTVISIQSKKTPLFLQNGNSMAKLTWMLKSYKHVYEINIAHWYLYPISNPNSIKNKRSAHKLQNA